MINLKEQCQAIVTKSRNTNETLKLKYPNKIVVPENSLNEKIDVNKEENTTNIIKDAREQEKKDSGQTKYNLLSYSLKDIKRQN